MPNSLLIHRGCLYTSPVPGADPIDNAAGLDEVVYHQRNMGVRPVIVVMIF